MLKRNYLISNLYSVGQNCVCAIPALVQIVSDSLSNQTVKQAADLNVIMRSDCAHDLILLWCHSRMSLSAIMHGGSILGSAG